MKSTVLLVNKVILSISLRPEIILKVVKRALYKINIIQSINTNASTKLLGLSWVRSCAIPYHYFNTSLKEEHLVSSDCSRKRY